MSNRKYRMLDPEPQTCGEFDRTVETETARIEKDFAQPTFLFTSNAPVDNWKFNWPGIAKLALAVILLILLGIGATFYLTGCSALQREVPQADPRTGEKLYMDPDGKNVNTKATDAQGKPRAEFTLPEKTSLFDDAGEMLGKALPPPFGGIGTLVFGAANVALAVWIRKERARRLAEAGLTEELVTSIDSVPEARKAISKLVGDTHSPALKSKVQEVRAQRSKAAVKKAA